MDGRVTNCRGLLVGALSLLLASASASARTGAAHLPGPVRAPPSADAPKKVSAASAPRNSWTRFERIGASVDFFSESSRLSGEQWINNFRSDESFDYGSGPFAFSVYGLVHPAKHWRFGPALRFLGGHGNDQFAFGQLTEASLLGEFSMHAFEKVDAVFGARAGFSLMFPSRSLASEIDRLKAQGANVWDVPRFGVVGGLNLGVRRHVAGHLFGRLDFSGQLAHQWLFSTDQVVSGLRFQKIWNAQTQRLGATLSAEVSF